jgi:hypothetical protein
LGCSSGVEQSLAYHALGSGFPDQKQKNKRKIKFSGQRGIFTVRTYKITIVHIWNTQFSMILMLIDPISLLSPTVLLGNLYYFFLLSIFIWKIE